MEGSPAVLCRNLHKTYPGGVEAVRGLDLEIPRGECFGLLGPNGAGKTTTIEILEGLSAPTAGEVRILGLPWRGHEMDLRQRMGISLQETRLSEKLTVRETINLFAAFYARPRPVTEVLEEMALTEKVNAWVGKLSGGQRQRLAVATALVGNPELLFLDEPTTGLDPQSRHQLWDVIRRFQSAGGTVLLTTHYMEEAERLCDRVAIVDHGRIIALGSPGELIESFVGPHVVEFALNDAARALNWAQSLPGVQAARQADGIVQMNVREPHRAIPALIAALEREGLTLAYLSTRRASLEDVFVHLTGRHLREA
ncbi:MAG TPA: ABC transporter ATP-binding protein [Terriglobales bacterium]|nr:ABC transporter ATP-binding protein [Terriglobales bacterium]